MYINLGHKPDKQQNKEIVSDPAPFYTVFEYPEPKTQGETSSRSASSD